MPSIQRAALVLTILLSMPPAARSQYGDDGPGGGVLINPSVVGPAVPRKGPSRTEPSAGAPKDNLRLQKLKTLFFDRRPSAILKVWAGTRADGMLSEEEKLALPTLAVRMVSLAP